MLHAHPYVVFVLAAIIGAVLMALISKAIGRKSGPESIDPRRH